MYYPEFFETLTSTTSSAPPLPPPPAPEMTRFRSQETVATIGSMTSDFLDLMKSGESFNALNLELKSGESLNIIEDERFESLQKGDLDWLNDEDDDDFDFKFDCHQQQLHHEKEEETSLRYPSLAPLTRRTSSRLATIRNENKQTVHKGRPSDDAVKAKRQRKVYDIAVHDRKYVTYTADDVLCQRGGLGNQHAGNKRYLAAKEALQVVYQATPKTGRTAVAQQLVDQVRAWGGRFLTKDSIGWYEIHNHKARTKASQSLRESYSKEELKAKRNKYKANQDALE